MDKNDEEDDEIEVPDDLEEEEDMIVGPQQPQTPSDPIWLDILLWITITLLIISVVLKALP